MISEQNTYFSLNSCPVNSRFQNIHFYSLYASGKLALPSHPPSFLFKHTCYILFTHQNISSKKLSMRICLIFCFISVFEVIMQTNSKVYLHFSFATFTLATYFFNLRMNLSNVSYTNLYHMIRLKIIMNILFCF